MHTKKNFKAKVIAKLFGEADEDIYDKDDALSGDSTEEDITAATSSTSVVDSETRACDVPFYGAHCTLTGRKLKCFNSNIIVNDASESESSDGDTGNESVSRKRKRHRKGHHNSLRTDQITSLTSAASQATQNVCCSNDSLPTTISSLTKNQKRKLKKRRKEKEKRTQSSSSVEFIFDSSAGTACS